MAHYRTFFDPISTISQHLVAPQHHYEIRNKFLNHIRGILERIPAWTGIHLWGAIGHPHEIFPKNFMQKTHHSPIERSFSAKYSTKAGEIVGNENLTAEQKNEALQKLRQKFEDIKDNIQQ